MLDLVENTKQIDIDVIVPYYEQNRFFPKGAVEPKLLQSTIDHKLDDVLKKAPIVTGEYDEDPETESPHSIVLRYPEDSHLIPFIERTIFNKLTAKQKQIASTNREIHDWTLMEFDPSLATLKIEADNGGVIRGEPIFEHETAHAREAYNSGQGIVYIVTPFYWQKEKNGKERLTITHSTTKVSPNLNAESLLNVAIAPRFFSQGDFMNANAMLCELNRPLDPLWLKLQSYQTQLPKLDGRGLKHEDMIVALHDKWKVGRA